ncbi:MAG: GNAT family N-acetyltransferase [Streptosporangiales bacterium]|nr:GNAT family N-acetyltransferase [Streptosporangiales bacterium]
MIPAGRFAAAAQPTLTAADGLVLRPWTLDDVPAIMAAYSDPVVQEWQGFRAEREDEARDMVTRWRDGWPSESSASWAVCSGSADGEVVGRMSLRDMNLRWGWAEVAYWTMPSAWGTGVAPRALSAMTEWAFDSGFHRIWLKHSTKNPASCRVAVKAGFEAEGTQRGGEIHPDGWHDMHVHARVNALRMARGCLQLRGGPKDLASALGRC